MSEPIFDETTERIYSRLPGHFRRMDVGTDYQLKRWISGVGSEMDVVNQLIERLDMTTVDEGGDPSETSDLVNPMSADLAWLPWLAQLYGSTIYGTLVDARRAEVLSSINGFQVGTTDAIRAAVQSELIGSQSVQIKKNETATGPGGQWDLLIQTLQSETLKNLVPEPLAQTVSSGVWDTIYTSTRRNYAKNPSFETATLAGTVSSASTGTISTDWATTSGGKSYKVTPNSTSNLSYTAIWGHSAHQVLGLTAGKTYHFSGTIYLPQAQTGTLGPLARRLSATVVSGATVVTQSDAAVNAAGATRLGVTFTIPSTGTTSVSLRLQNGGNNTSTPVYFDELMVEEVSTLRDYFDSTTANTTARTHSGLADSGTSLATYTPTYLWKNLVDEPSMYQSRAMMSSIRDDTWQGSGILRGVSSPTFSVVPGDTYNLLISLGMRSVEGTPLSRTGRIGYIFYNASDGVVSTHTGNITVTEVMQQFKTTVVAPATATYAKIFWEVDGVTSNITPMVAQVAVREEEDDIWVPRSADPIRGVIERGAKPAGVVLHYSPIFSNWDTVTDFSTKTWNEVEGKTWIAVEESS